MDNQEGNSGSWFEENKKVFMFLGVFLILAIVIVMVFFIMRLTSQPHQPPPETPAPAATSTPETTKPPVSTLPSASETGNGSGNGNGAEALAVEKAKFGDFYKTASEEDISNKDDLNLPLNIKVDATDYYDVYRKINLDNSLASLNENGFAILDNPFSAEADDFYKMNALLDAKDLPLMVTGDFLVYYYQNVLKNVYKDLENSVFYDNLWATGKSLYGTAKERYEIKLNREGRANDVSLEGARLELAYFATALSLLEPMQEQISRDGGLSKGAGFTPAEADQFSFTLPDYLQEEVGREVKLIREAKVLAKSPVLTYERDYKIFSIPDAYKKNARLHNFYLASRWLNSVFPLNYKSEACPSCLLDKDDWRLNMAAAFYIALDFGNNQELQNRWAKIYKIQSFFSGLRGDLSYVYYRDAFREIFGADRQVDDILDDNNEEIDKNLSILQAKLLSLDFPAIEGGLNKIATATKPILGLKILVDAYRPDDYITGELIYPQVGYFRGATGKMQEEVFTFCNLKAKEKPLRCYGSAYDILNLIHPLDQAESGYFVRNADYENYEVQADKLRQAFNNQDAAARHNTNYWATLDIAQKLLTAPEKEKTVVMKTAAWQEKNLQTALAIWANGNLPSDLLTSSDEPAANRLNQMGGENPYAAYRYVEPDLTLIRELIANTKMIEAMLALLRVDQSGNNVLEDLGNLQKNLESLQAIAKQELQDKSLSEENYEFIGNFAKEFLVKEAGSKSFHISSPYGDGLLENLSGVKLLAYVYQLGEKKYIVVGPVFNYQEKRK